MSNGAIRYSTWKRRSVSVSAVVVALVVLVPSLLVLVPVAAIYDLARRRNLPTVRMLLIAVCYLAKVLGYLAPHGWLERPRVSRVAALVTVSLLAALVAVQMLASGRGLAVDSRLAAVAVAAVALWRRLPFVVVVVLAALVAAVLRAAGCP